MGKRKLTVAQIAVIMIVLNLGCKVLGFVREMAMAAFYGTGYIVDSFVMAQTIPNILLGGILAAIASAYMPLFSKKVEENGEDAGNVYTSQVIVILVFLSTLTAIIGFVFAEPIVDIMAKGFDEQAKALTAFYLRITFGYTVFVSVIGIYANFLQYKGRFLLQILGDYLQNIAVVIMIVISASFNNRLLAFGLFIGYALKCIIMLILAKRRGYRFRFQTDGLQENVKSIIVLSIPVFMGTMAQEVNIFVDRTLASGLGSGNISALNYAYQIVKIIISISITILTTIIYPKLVQLSQGQNKSSFVQVVQKGFNLVLLIAIPVMLGSIVYGEEIVRLIYERGVFNRETTVITAMAYQFYAIGIVFISLNEYLTKIFYSLHDMKTPMICAGIGVCVNIALSLVLVRYMEQNGLALATSLAAFTSTMLRIILFKKKYKGISLIKAGSNILAIIASAIIMIVISYLIFYLLMEILGLVEIVSLVGAIVIAGIVYLIFLKLFKVDEVDYIKKSLLKR